MTASTSAIADTLVTMFSAASQFGPGNASKDSYQALETSTGSCMLVKWTRYQGQPMTFGSNQPRQTWNFNLKCYLRDTGDPSVVLGKVWTATDNIINCLADDATLLGVVDDVINVSATHDPETAYTVGGATWLTLEFNVEPIIY